MSTLSNKSFGTLITHLIRKNHLSRKETKEAFTAVLDNAITPMQQGAFLAALTSKGETAEEVAGAFEAIYECDTTKVTLDTALQPVENCGTGMDTFKTFNISTAAAIVAAAGGVSMARHGARAITSVCGTVDMAEVLGVDVECPAEMVASSIATAGLGLFNGMSPQIHPNALGRILSQIHFGSTLNIAASLANPALPEIGVRGVYARDRVLPVANVMQAIGYKNAIVLHGTIDATTAGMDEASVCGMTHCARICEDRPIETFTIDPKGLGFKSASAEPLAPLRDRASEAKRFVDLINNKENSVRKDAVTLNAGLIFLAAGKVAQLEEGIERAFRNLESGEAFRTLEKWVKAQNRTPAQGLERLYRLAA